MLCTRHCSRAQLINLLLQQSDPSCDKCEVWRDKAREEGQRNNVIYSAFKFMTSENTVIYFYMCSVCNFHAHLQDEVTKLPYCPLDSRYRIFAFDHDLFSFADLAFDEWPVVLITNPKSLLYSSAKHEPLERLLHSTHIRYVAVFPNFLSVWYWWRISHCDFIPMWKLWDIPLQFSQQSKHYIQISCLLFHSQLKTCNFLSWNFKNHPETHIPTIIIFVYFMPAFLFF